MAWRRLAEQCRYNKCSRSAIRWPRQPCMSIRRSRCDVLSQLACWKQQYMVACIHKVCSTWLTRPSRCKYRSGGV
jgi:hypothetical protein